MCLSQDYIRKVVHRDKYEMIDGDESIIRALVGKISMELPIADFGSRDLCMI